MDLVVLSDCNGAHTPTTDLETGIVLKTFSKRANESGDWNEYISKIWNLNGENKNYST